MDAREYLNRQGVGVDREPDKPNTLEEKAWERARGSGHQRPKSGTPFDWEEWERHHNDLAADAETLEQKIDKEAHRKALEKEKQDNALKKTQVSTSEEQAGQGGQGSVDHFDPSSPASSSQATRTQPSNAGANQAQMPVQAMPGAVKTAYMVLAVLMPPLAVGLSGGQAKRVGIACILTLLLWVPGVVYAARWIFSR